MKVLQTVAAWLAGETPWFITAVAVATFFAPDLFGWVRGDTQTEILGVIMLTMGMTLTTEDFRVLASRPLDIALGALAQFTLMPLIAFGLTHPAVIQVDTQDPFVRQPFQHSAFSDA